MNINTRWFETRQSDPVVYTTPKSLADTILDHHGALAGAGVMAVGPVVLLSDPDPELAAAGSVQVWSKTDEGAWVWVNHDGEIIESACPIGD